MDLKELRRLAVAVDALEHPAMMGDIDAARWVQAQNDLARELYRQRGPILAALETGAPPTRDEMVAALQHAWNDFVGDTGCFPDCFTWRGGNGTMNADFSFGNFARMVAQALAEGRRRAAVTT